MTYSLKLITDVARLAMHYRESSWSQQDNDYMLPLDESIAKAISAEMFGNISSIDKLLISEIIEKSLVADWSILQGWIELVDSFSTRFN